MPDGRFQTWSVGLNDLIVTDILVLKPINPVFVYPPLTKCIALERHTRAQKIDTVILTD